MGGIERRSQLSPARESQPRAHAFPAGVRDEMFVAIVLLDKADKRPVEREVEQPACRNGAAWAA
jgi:hypothetical protein